MPDTQPVTRVDFFRRMPTGGATSHFKPEPWPASCEHPGEYLRMGDHPDVTGRWVPEDIDPNTLYCLRCEQEVPEITAATVERRTP